MASTKAYGITRLSKEKLMKVLAIKSLEPCLSSLLVNQKKHGLDAIKRAKEQIEFISVIMTESSNDVSKGNAQIAKLKLISVAASKLGDAVKRYEQGTKKDFIKGIRKACLLMKACEKMNQIIQNDNKL